MAKKGATLLKVARSIRGLTQEEVAQIYGVSRKTYCNWERGATSVSYDDLWAICEQVFKMPLEDVTRMASHAA